MGAPLVLWPLGCGPYVNPALGCEYWGVTYLLSLENVDELELFLESRHELVLLLLEPAVGRQQLLQSLLLLLGRVLHTTKRNQGSTTARQSLNFKHPYKEGRKELFYFKRCTQHILFTVIWRQTYGKGPLR